MSSVSAEFVPDRLRERLTAAILRAGLRVALKPVLSPCVPITWQRRWLEWHARWLHARSDAMVSLATVGGVAGEWTRPPGPAAVSQCNILYLHGGGYCVGSPATHRSVTAHIACAAHLPVFAARYRLAPEHPFPAALDDAMAAYCALAADTAVVIAGDSAGAGLALATTLALRDRQVPPPVALVLFSPWVDLAIAAAPSSASANDPTLSRNWLDLAARHYLAGADPASPHASPIHGDLRTLPPTLIQAGADEIFCEDVLALQRGLRRAGVEVTCELVPGRWHAFQLHAGMLPSADAAIERAACFVARVIAEDITANGAKTSGRPG